MGTLTVLQPIAPTFTAGWPSWWHHHGIKVHIGPRQRGAHKPTLLLCSSVLDVTIRRVGNQQLWRIAWILKHASGQTNGFVHLETLELEAAFGLREHLDEDSGALLARYGASSAIQEKFIRYERWLNLPGPGTGLDGDPNVSIDVDDGIKDAVAQLIANRYR